MCLISFNSLLDWCAGSCGNWKKTAWPRLTVVCFVNSYPVESDLSNEQRYPPFEQLSPSVSPSNYNELVSSSRKILHHREHTILLS